MSKKTWTAKQREAAIRDELIAEGAVQAGVFTAASGEVADTKISMDVMYRNQPLLDFITSELARRAKSYKPDIIIPVPRGANRIGKLVAERMGIEVALMEWEDKAPGRKAASPADEIDAKLITESNRALVIEDVYSTGESSHAIATHQLLASRAVGVLSIWSRLKPEERIEVPYKTTAILEEYIPFQRNSFAASDQL